MRESWNAYLKALDGYVRLPTRPEREDTYFRVLQPTFLQIKQRADDILGMNQDAMVRKSDLVADRAHLLEQIVTAAVVLVSILGLLAATYLMARVLRPLRVVSAAVRRFGEGDLKARADVRGDDEIAAVAAEFNSMAERLERYRASSLGELLQAQQAAQAAIDGIADPVVLLDGTGKLQGANTAASYAAGRQHRARGRRSVRGRRSRGARADRSPPRARAGGQGRVRPQGVRGGGARAVGARRRAHLASARDADLRRGRHRRGRRDRAPGHHAAVSLRRAQERSGGHRGARVPDAADVAADGAAPGARRRRSAR